MKGDDEVISPGRRPGSTATTWTTSALPYHRLSEFWNWDGTTGTVRKPGPPSGRPFARSWTAARLPWERKSLPPRMRNGSSTTRASPVRARAAVIEPRHSGSEISGGNFPTPLMLM